MIRVALAVVMVVSVTCGSPSPARPTADPSVGSADPLTLVRTRGSLIVGIRVAVSPAGQQLDVAHGQKRALESAVVTELAKKVIGPNAKVQFRELGRDRHTLVERAEADIAMISAAEPPSPGIVLTTPYAAGGVVIAVKSGSTATEPRSLAGQVIAATTMGEANANELTQTYLRDKGIAATTTPFPGLAAAVAALDSGQVTAVAGDRTGIALLQRGRAEPMRVIGAIADRPYVLAVRQDASTLHAALTAALKDLLASGDVQKMATAAAFPYEAP